MDVLESSTRENTPALRSLVAENENGGTGNEHSVCQRDGRPRGGTDGAGDPGELAGKNTLTDFADKRVKFCLRAERHDQNLGGGYHSRQGQNLGNSGVKTIGVSTSRPCAQGESE